MKREFSNNRLYGGYYVFLNADGIKTDKELLELFGIKNTNLLTKENQKDFFNYDAPKIYVTETGNWKHLIDNWSFNLLIHLFKIRKQSLKDLIVEIGNKFELFEASISDVDDCFSYRYFIDGELKRHYSLSPKNGSYTENFVDVDFGEKRNGELKLLKIKEQHQKIFEIAKLYGVEIYHEIKKIRCYNLME